MVQRLIFLDFDGVLNSFRSDIALHGVSSNPDPCIGMFNYIDPKFDPIAVGLVRRLCEITGAKIVISSSWRKRNELENLYMSFDYYQWNTRGIMIGMTPSLYKLRGFEIEEWLLQNAKPDDKYIIFDDGADMLPSQQDVFIKTNPAIGISYEDFLKAVQLLS